VSAEVNGITESDGASRRRRAQGAKADALQDALTAMDPQMAEWANEFVFGQVWKPGPLSFEEQLLVAVVALGATGNALQLKNYLHGALQGGMDKEKIGQALRMLTVYAGFPRAIDALNVLDQCVSAHERNATL
jgi:4-carboxymuconolactone decarboxylase